MEWGKKNKTRINLKMAKYTTLAIAAISLVVFRRPV